MEENVLAILDGDDSKETRESTDDRLAFLRAVRAVSLVPEEGVPPTKKMYEAVFRMLRFSNSLELIVESYRLLVALEKRYPRVYISESLSELVVSDMSWSPFVFSIEIASNKKEGAGLDMLSFLVLIQQLAEVGVETSTVVFEAKALRICFLFQYLVIVLENDFTPRNKVYQNSLNWILLRESFLSMLVSSRQINYKGLMKDCLSNLCRLHEVSVGMSNNVKCSDESTEIASQNEDTVTPVALLEQGSMTCAAMLKLLIMIMELDVSRKKADMEGCTTRADSVREPLMEIILDELTYNEYLLSPFLQIFTEPGKKLEIVLLYLLKYIAKDAVRTRRRSNAVAKLTGDATIIEVLNWVSTLTNTKSIVKKLGTDVVQLLLSHAFQACLSVLSSEQSTENISHLQGSSLTEICNYTVSAFSNLKRIDGDVEISALGKQAIFTAATILSTS